MKPCSGRRMQPKGSPGVLVPARTRRGTRTRKWCTNGRRLPQTGEKTGRRRLADASGPYAGMGRLPYRQPSAKDLQKMAASADAGPRGAADGSLDASPSPSPSPAAPPPRRTPSSDASARPASPRSRPPSSPAPPGPPPLRPAPPAPPSPPPAAAPPPAPPSSSPKESATTAPA